MVGFSMAPTVLSAFAASLVEFVEALTVVLAVGTVRGWRWALLGTGAALTVLVALVVTFGQSLERVPLPWVELVLGTLTLLFGLRWLRKAILRYAGAIALHDEAAAYVKETTALRDTQPRPSGSWDTFAFAAAFKIVMIEGLEVVFIVIAMGTSGRSLVPASLGAIAAFCLVVGLGVALHRPLANIPENALKFVVGILLTAFGSFWVGEGMQLQWPAGDWSLLMLVAAYFLTSMVLVSVCRATLLHSDRGEKKASATRSKGALAAFYHELISLFVDDRAFAVGILVWAAAAWASVGRVPLEPRIQCALFVLGFAGLLSYSALRASHTDASA